MSNRPGQKLFYKIGEVSRLAGVEPYILRYWETEFPRLSPRKNKGGQRVYRQRDLDLVLTIKRMLHEEGYTIAGARKKLAEAGRVAVREDSSAGVLEPAVPEDVSAHADAGGTAEELAGKLASLKKEIKDVLDIIK
ncbi:MAG: MerR family transcriptional regulator [Nitrospirae bacterium]|nr:MerR family transcriptional regulator [Nitrospirota bacterium]